MIFLSHIERRDFLAGLTKRKVMARPGPTPNHVEVFTDSPTEEGFRRWVEVPMTHEGLQSLAYDGAAEYQLAEAAYEALDRMAAARVAA